MRGQCIPVVWGIDRKYVLQAFVVMRSILQHSGENYHFFILTADRMEIEEEVWEAADILRKEYGNFRVTIRYADPACFETARIYNRHLSAAAYFRLLIPELVPEYDKCIYLDCDILVHGDLKELYGIRLGDHYLAGVKDCHIIADIPREWEHQHIMGLPARDCYINSGVMVMGLKKLRQDKMTVPFLEQLEKENWNEDQDVLNVCCYPQIMTIPLKYNLFHFYTGAGIRHLYGLPYDSRDFDFDHDVPFILHLGGAYKAWDDPEVRGSREWWKTAEVFSRTRSYQSYQKRCFLNGNDSRLSKLIARAKGSRHVAVWGYSANGRRLCDILLEYQVRQVEFFADSNEAAWGQAYKGIPVRALPSVSWKECDTLWIISCQIAYGEVIRQLKENGVSEKNIVRYIEPYTDSFYLLSRDACAYDSMVRGMAEREYVRRIPDRSDRERYIKDIMENPLQHSTEYAYLAEKYSFQYWFETWHRERTENEDDSDHGLPE